MHCKQRLSTMQVVGTLYLTPTSPACRAVLFAEKALGIKSEQIVIDIKKGEHLQPSFIKVNPQHTVPTYIDRDGATVWDSHAIMPYLVSKYGKSDELYPKNLEQRAIIDQRMHFETGVLYPLLKSIVLPIVQQKSKVVSEQAYEESNNIYALLNAFLDGNKWIAGKTLTIADFSIIASVASLEYFKPIDETKYKNLFDWSNNCKALPYYQEANAGLDMFKQFIQSLM